MNDARPDISVVVPFQNSAAHIERCVAALLAQDLPADRYELILVGNNSTDHSEAIASAFAGIRILREPKPGAYAARNRGVAEARGEMVVFTDADCAPCRSWLRCHAEAMSLPHVDVVLGSRNPGRSTMPLRLMTLYEETKAAAIFGGADKALYYGYTNNMAVRKHTLTEFGGFQEVIRGADSVFIRQLIDRRGCQAVSYCSEAAITHLEIQTLRQWYTKHAIYGRSNQWNSRRAVTCQPMTMRSRWRTYRAAVHAHSLGPIDSAVLLGVLVGGGISYEAGRIGARLGSQPRR